jgi:hypothetical protein
MLLGCAVEELEVVIVQLAVLLGFPKLAQREIAEDLLAGITVWSPLRDSEEQFSGGFKAGGTRGNVYKLSGGNAENSVP